MPKVKLSYFDFPGGRGEDREAVAANPKVAEWDARFAS